MYKISSYLMIAESVALKKIYKKFACIGEHLCSSLPSSKVSKDWGSREKYSVFYRDKRVKEC